MLRRFLVCSAVSFAALVYPVLAQGDTDALWSAGRRLDAIAALRARVEREPLDAGLRLRLVDWEIAVRRYQPALEHLGLAASGPAEPAEFRARRASILYLLGRYEEALPLLDRADREQCLWAVDALWALGRLDESAAALEQAVAARGAEDPRVLTLRGRELARLGRHAEAAEVFARASSADPLDMPALFGLGQALVRSGRRDEGLAALERHRALVPLIDQLEFARASLDVDPSNAPNHAAVGDAERAIGRTEEAERAYLEAERLAEPGEHVAIALRLARLYREDQGDLARALAALDRAHARAPDARLLVRAGDLLHVDGRSAEAATRFEAALALRPNDAQIRARLDAARAAAGGVPK